MLTVNTIASGGGSIIKFDGQKISVGPNSAGANPGPACYGLNGPLTITDCNFILGKLNSSYFPKIFGPNADKELNLTKINQLDEYLKLTDEIILNNLMKL